jgi:hypothetical protein
MWIEVETKRLGEEKAEVEPMLTQRTKTLELEDKKRLDQEEWQAFIDCTHLPDVSKESELSTYIALWEEEQETDIERTMQDTQLALQVIRGLEGMVNKALTAGDSTGVDKYRGYLRQIKLLIQQKIDRASAWMLEHVDQFIAADNTCQIEHSSALQKLGIWVNIAKNLRLKNIEYSSLGVVTDVPRPIILQTCALRLVHFRKDVRSHDEAGDFFTIGGVLILEVLDVPERPKQIKSHIPDVKEGGNWSMKRVSESTGSVVRQEYPSKDPTTGIVAKVPPINIRFTLPGDVLLAEGVVPRIGWWNAEKRDGEGDWDEEGIADVSLEAKEEGKVLTFTSNHITALAVLQSRWACFPYQGWMLQPTGPNLAVLTVHLNGDLTVKIEIGAGSCRLVSPAEDALADLRDHPRPAMDLLQDLIFHGLNLLPADADADKLSSHRVDFPGLLKKPSLEERACLGASLLAPAFALSCSRVNATLGPTEATLRAAPVTDLQAPPLTEDDTLFRTVLFREAELSYCLLLDPAAESATHSANGEILDRDGSAPPRPPPALAPPRPAALACAGAEAARVRSGREQQGAAQRGARDEVPPAEPDAGGIGGHAGRAVRGLLAVLHRGRPRNAARHAPALLHRADALARGRAGGRRRGRGGGRRAGGAAGRRGGARGCRGRGRRGRCRRAAGDSGFREAGDSGFREAGDSWWGPASSGRAPRGGGFGRRRRRYGVEARHGRVGEAGRGRGCTGARAGRRRGTSRAVESPGLCSSPGLYSSGTRGAGAQWQARLRQDGWTIKICRSPILPIVLEWWPMPPFHA